MREEERSLFKAASQVDQIYNLLQHYEVQVPPEHLVAHEDLHERLHEYRKEMDAAVAYKESKLGEMSNHLDLNIFKLSEQVTIHTYIHIIKLLFRIRFLPIFFFFQHYN